MATDINDLDGVGGRTVEKLNKAGIETITELGTAKPSDIAANCNLSEERCGDLVEKASIGGVPVRSGADAKREAEKREHIPSGISGLDDMLGGGWREGQIHAFGGPPGSGKSQCSFKSLVNAVESTDVPALYIETEPNRYSPERLEALANQEGVQEDIYLIEAWDLEQQKYAYETAMKELEDLSLVVVDSFTAPFRLSDQFEDRSSLTERSAVISRHIQSLQKLAIEKNVPVILTAQAYGNPKPYSEDFALYGGSVFEHSVGALLKTRTKKDLFEVELEKHPSRGPQKALINITDTDLNGVDSA